MSDIKIGDRVEVTVYRRNDDWGVGWVGNLEKIDSDDVPYLVRRADGDTVWAVEVRKVDTGRIDREALVSRAKELLAGTPHTVTDIINMANFLAGE
ncbi:hypothetical protein B5180_01595 [Streptomyces sp. BF-3]|nr:hypothetical protein B5180_01595 [Streptomyces sp. BF-3]